MLKDNILLTIHRTMLVTEPEILRMMKDKISKYDTIVFESNYYNTLLQSPELHHIIDFYLFMEAKIQGKKIEWLNEMKDEIEIFQNFLNNIDMTQMEYLQYANSRAQIEIEFLNEMYKSELKIERIKEFIESQFTKEQVKLKEQTKIIYDRDLKWDLSNPNKLYIIGAAHAINHEHNVFEEEK